MKRFRAALGLLLGLTVLVQSQAAAAAVVSVHHASGPAAAAQMKAACHHESPGSPTSRCCADPDCASLTDCAFAQPAMAFQAMLALAIPKSAFLAGAPAILVADPESTVALRPPIALHA